MKKISKLLIQLLLLLGLMLTLAACNISYTVTFNTDDGSPVASQTVNKGEKATRPTVDPTKDDYDFDNWYKNSAKTILFDFDTEIITADTAIYAKWNENVVSFTVSFDVDDGSTVASQSVKEGRKATRPTVDPTKEDYDFDNWYKDSDKVIPFDFDIEAIEENTTIYAGWIVKPTQAASFETTIENGKIIVNRFIGSETEVRIPQTIDGKEVMAIAEKAFLNCVSLISVIIPDTVISMGFGAFIGCDSLKHITLPFVGNTFEDNDKYSRTRHFSYIFGAIYNDGWASVDGRPYENTSLKSVKITKDTEITECSFYGYVGLVIISIPATVTSIIGNAFNGCVSLEKINVDNVNPIFYSEGTSIIQKQTNILVVGSTAGKIPNGIKAIGDYAFSFRDNLTIITIPNSVRSIGEFAFFNCPKLLNIIIPDSVEDIGYGAFYSTAWDKMHAGGMVYIGKVLYKYVGKMSADTVINNVRTDTISIAGGAFESCDSLSSITIPNSVRSIGNYTFLACSKLTSIKIGTGVTSIGNGAFYFCERLESITLPDSVTSIGDSAFRSCRSLISITIPDSVKVIGDFAFEGCDNLTSVNVATTNSYYSSAKGVLFNKSQTHLICYPGGKTTQEYVIPDSVTSIGDYAFSGCINLASITIPNSVTSIGRFAFFDCSSLTSVTFENASGWYVTENEDATNATDLTLTDSLINAEYLRSTYCFHYWYRR